VTHALLEARNLTKHFGAMTALSGVSLSVKAGEVNCLLGDNGAGKSTLIKILAGVHRPSSGEIYIEGRRVAFATPREARDSGVSTVFQDLAMIPLMSVTRNFFLGREPVRRVGPLAMLDIRRAAQITFDEVRKMGIQLRDPEQPVGTLSGGERQSIAIARAVYFGAKVLILDEPTAALGVTQTAIVLETIKRVRAQGLGVIFITHNARHAIEVGDRFTVLNRGRTIDSQLSGKPTPDLLQDLMSAR